MTLNELNLKLKYFFDSLLKLYHCDTSCPSCGTKETELIFRKMIVTALFECNECGLRYRVPKDSEKKSLAFYQSNYDAGFTTYLPSDTELENFLSHDFKGGEKDFSEYIRFLIDAGVSKGEKLLDFGSSWGYGSWQMQKIGFDVYSYEVDKRRSTFAKDKLHLKIVEDLEAIKGSMDCIFSSHVLEHLPDPNIFFFIADQVLVPKGKVVCVVPNGEPELERVYGELRYHQMWGHVHPLLFNKKSLESLAISNKFKPYVAPFPCTFDELINNHQNTALNRKELLLFAVRK